MQCELIFCYFFLILHTSSIDKNSTWSKTLIQPTRKNCMQFVYSLYLQYAHSFYDCNSSLPFPGIVNLHQKAKDSRLIPSSNLIALNLGEKQAQDEATSSSSIIIRIIHQQLKKYFEYKGRNWQLNVIKEQWMIQLHSPPYARFSSTNSTLII